MTMVARTPFSASMRETSKALSPPPITATCEPKSRLGAPTAAAPTWRRPAAATRRAFATRSSHSSPANLVPVAITMAGPDNDRGRTATRHYSANSPVVLPPQGLWRAAVPGLDCQLADVAGELGGVLAPTFPALSEQPLVGIGAELRHTAERALLLDDHGMHAVI